MMRALPENIIAKARDWNNQIVPDRFRNFKITIKFKTGRNGNAPIAFDSVVSHYAAIHVLGRDFWELSADHDVGLPLGLPLAKVQWQDNFFYVCGWLPGVPQKTAFWTKRFEKSLLSAVNANRISVRSGIFKSFMMPTLYDPRKTFIIWGKGDIEILKSILPSPMKIGKKVAVGFGIAEWKIEEAVVGGGLMIQNYLQRPLPLEFCKENGWKIERGHQVDRPLHGPYFGSNSESVLCWDVGSRLAPK